jgi:TonB family protein
MKAKFYPNLLLTLVVISVTTLPSCKSSFPTAGTVVECNGQLLKPILNPTKRADFLGGKQALSEFLRANLNLPQEAINHKIKGKVRVAFIVTKEGEICDLRITSKPNKYIDNEVIRVMKKMPKWIPGINENEIVDCYYLLDLRL